MATAAITKNQGFPQPGDLAVLMQSLNGQVRGRWNKISAQRGTPHDEAHRGDRRSFRRSRGATCRRQRGRGRVKQAPTRRKATVEEILEEAERIVDELLSEVESWKHKLETANRTHLPKYKELTAGCEMLTRARNTLASAIDETRQGLGADLLATSIGIPSRPTRSRRQRFDTVHDHLVRVIECLILNGVGEADVLDGALRVLEAVASSP